MNKFGFKTGITIAVTVATVALALCSGLLTSFSMLFGLFMAVFVSYLYISCGGICSLINVALTCMGVLLISRWQLSSLILVAIGFVPGLVLGIMQKRRFGYYEGLKGSSLAFGAMIILSVYLATVNFNGGLGGFFDALTSDMKIIAAQSLSGNEIEGLKIEDVNVMIEEAMLLVRNSIPEIVIIISMILGYIHIALTEIVVRKTTGIQLDIVKLDRHKAPRHLVYVSFVISIIYLFGSDEGAFWTITQNTMDVLDFILAFCGFSFIESKFKQTVKIGFLRGIIYVVALFISSGFAMQILTLVGMFDGLRDYRGIKEW